MSARVSRIHESPGAAGPVVRLADDWDDPRRDPEAWRDLALCAETDPDAFYPDKGGSIKEAKRLCGACEVRAECLEFALTDDAGKFGIWGATSERERRRIKRERQQEAA